MALITHFMNQSRQRASDTAVDTTADLDSRRATDRGADEPTLRVSCTTFLPKPGGEPVQQAGGIPALVEHGPDAWCVSPLYEAAWPARGEDLVCGGGKRAGGRTAGGASSWSVLHAALLVDRSRQRASDTAVDTTVGRATDRGVQRAYVWFAHPSCQRNSEPPKNPATSLRSC